MIPGNPAFRSPPSPVCAPRRADCRARAGCCIFHKRRAFGESDSDESDSDFEGFDDPPDAGGKDDGSSGGGGGGGAAPKSFPAYQTYHA